jgi:hypothetical protein
MKNIHIIPTNKPSRLHEFGDIWFSHKEPTECFRNYNIYITSNEKPKKGEWSIYLGLQKKYKVIEDIIGDEFPKIILTTDPDLIAEGVQAIDDKFLEWFVKNPSCEWVETFIDTMGCSLEDCDANPCVNYKIIIPQKEPKQTDEKGKTLTYWGGLAESKQKNCCTPIGQIKRYIDCKGCDKKPNQETLEEVNDNRKNLYFKKQVMNPYAVEEYSHTAYEKGFIEGYEESTKYQAKKMFTKEQARIIWEAGQEYWKTSGTSTTFEELIENLKKK